MLNNNHQSTAIACASGGFKTIFIHGVLSALEEANIKADAYAAASGSVIPSAWAAIGKARESGMKYWLEGLKVHHQTKSMSQVCLGGISYFNDRFGQKLFTSNPSDFYIATSAVTSDEAAEQTQSKQARRLGKKLLIAAAKNERSWVKRHLRLDLFSTTAKDNLALNRDNFSEVAYASGRMLHNYDIPAWINNQPYIDACYTCVCPALEMVERGYQTVIAIATETGNFYRDLFQSQVIPTQYQQVPIRIIQPDINPKDMGVDVFQATPEGITAVYQHGLNKGREFLA
jgi:predicted patatin/cPLA2 family phospholipase